MVTHDDHDDFGGLHRDLRATGAAMGRRNLFRMAAKLGGAVGALQLLGCGGSSTSPTASTATTTTPTPTTNAACSVIPNETEGPFPGDGSNGPNVLTLSGVVRSDIRASFAGLSGTADGVPLTIALTIVSKSTCAPIAGRAVYLWHCDRVGRYSLYTSGATNQNYLRGIQESDSTGKVTFTSIYPGCYSGRWPHIHFEVYPSLATAVSVANKIATSQIAMQKILVRPRLRDRRIRGQHPESLAGDAGERHGLQRRRVARAADDDRQRGGRADRRDHGRGLVLCTGRLDAGAL